MIIYVRRREWGVLPSVDYITISVCAALMGLAWGLIWSGKGPTFLHEKFGKGTVFGKRICGSQKAFLRLP